MSVASELFGQRPGSGARAFAGRIGLRLRNLGASITRRKQIEDLGRLDDRMLSDIGLTRSDLRAAAQWSLWGDPTERLASAALERRAARIR